MVRAFCRPHAYSFSEQSKMTTTLTPQTDVISESHVTDGEPETAVSANKQKIKSIKNQHQYIYISLHLRLVTHLSIISMVILHT